MFSFKSFALFTALTFGVVSAFAIPTLRARADVVSDLLQILEQLLSGLLGPLGLLREVTPATATEDNLGPIVANITVLLNGAVANINAVVAGNLTSAIGTNVSADATVDGVMALLTQVLQLVFGVLGNTMASVDGTVDLQASLAPVGDLLTELVSSVLEALGGPTPVTTSALGSGLSGVLGVVMRLAGGLLALLNLSISR